MWIKTGRGHLLLFLLSACLIGCPGKMAENGYHKLLIRAALNRNKPQCHNHADRHPAPCMLWLRLVWRNLKGYCLLHVAAKEEVGKVISFWWLAPAVVHSYVTHTHKHTEKQNNMCSNMVTFCSLTVRLYWSWWCVSDVLDLLVFIGFSYNSRTVFIYLFLPRLKHLG